MDLALHPTASTAPVGKQICSSVGIKGANGTRTQGGFFCSCVKRELCWGGPLSLSHWMFAGLPNWHSFITLCGKRRCLISRPLSLWLISRPPSFWATLGAPRDTTGKYVRVHVCVFACVCVRALCEIIMDVIWITEFRLSAMFLNKFIFIYLLSCCWNPTIGWYSFSSMLMYICSVLYKVHESHLRSMSPTRMLLK